MEELIIQINEFCEMKYKEFKDSSSTYGELEKKIQKLYFCNGSDDMTNSDIYSLIANKILEIHKSNLRKKTID